MVHIQVSGKEHILAWQNGRYRDQAGHLWELTEGPVSLAVGHGGRFPYTVVALENEDFDYRKGRLNAKREGSSGQ